LRAVDQLSNAGIPVGVLVAPVIPAITDTEMEAILKASAGAGATHSAYILLRLPYEVSDLFREWLRVHYPLRADHVMSLVRQSRGGRDNDPRFGKRMRGEGVFADLISRRFKLSCDRFGLRTREKLVLDTSIFRRPTPQMDLLA
jgi:DNA repair photolyase